MIANPSYEKGRDYEQCRILKRQLLKRFSAIPDSVWTKTACPLSNVNNSLRI